jgi:transposase
MPRIDFAVAIVESDEELGTLERRLRGRPTQVRVQLLRLLKRGQARSLRAAAPVIGYSLRQVSRWWASYREQGLAAMLQTRPRPGRQARMSAAAWAGLEQAMARGEIATQRDAQRYLREHWDIVYSIQGISYQFQQRGIRRKTGRRQHQRADPAAHQEYKRRLWRAAGRDRMHAGVGHG